MPPVMPDNTETLAPRAGGSRPAEATQNDDESTPSERLERLAPDDPDRYHAVTEHARGGLGRVVRAVDRRLGRTVAVKELLRHDPANESRFLREAMITARLEHPGIVPVHEAGRWPNGDPYYVMKLVEGRTLKELICEGKTLRERLACLPHVIAVADAVGYAHSEGVIHRDLKPSNVIVGEFGETIVVDWGLARDRKRNLPEPPEELLAATGSGCSTVSGKVVGTPAYMSPEQARGDLVDERADVYALGAVLYEMLAGEPPHADTTPQAVLDRVIAGPPRPLPMVVPGVPGELATIVRKAMARDPETRYPNAGALAEDLRRFTTGQLVSAHSYSTWALVRKRLARHRGVVAVVVASVLVLGAVGVASFRRVVAERNIARSQRVVAVDALASAEKRKRELVLLQAETALTKDPTAALAWLKTYDVGPADRGTVVDVIDEALALGVARHVFRPNDWVYDARFTPDGNTLVAAVRDGVIRAYDVHSGFETSLGQAPSPTETLLISPDGELVVTGGSLGEVVVWPLRGGKPRVVLEGSGRAIADLRIANERLLVEREASAPQVVALAGGAPTLLAPANGLRFAVAADDWSRVVYASAANEISVPGGGVIARTDHAISHLAISPRGDTVLVHDGTQLWVMPFDGHSPGALRPLAAFEDAINALAWSPDERSIALGSRRRPEILVIDIATTAVTELRGHSDASYTLTFSRDGARLLSASDDSTARLWTLATRNSLVLRGHDDDVFCARFSPDERSVATASIDGSVRIWDIDNGSAATFSEGAPLMSLRLQGDRAVTRTSTEVARWDLDSGVREELFSWANDGAALGYGTLSFDGQYLVLLGADGSLELRARSGVRRTLRGHRGVVTHLEMTRDDRWLYSSGSDGSLRRWDVATGAGSVVLQDPAPVRQFTVARDGRVVAQAGDTTYLIAADGAIHRLGNWCLDSAEFEPTHDLLLIHRCDKSLAVVTEQRPFDNTTPPFGSAASLGKAKLIELPTGGYKAVRVVSSPDGRWFASGLGDRTIRIWDAATGQVVDILRGHADLVYDVAFSPSGRELASASYDKTVRLWDLVHKRHRVLRGHAEPVFRVAWRDDDHLVSGAADGTIRLWNAPSLEPPSAAEITERLNTATSARIDLDRPTSGAPVSARGT